jgi:redox-sensitive bicupin YhaK (pirin superfamily)
LPAEAGHSSFVYVFEGEALFPGGTQVAAPQLAVLGEGGQVQASAGKAGTRFLLVCGKPLGEPVARYGPFVMNTREEIEQTLKEIREGTFIAS